MQSVKIGILGLGTVGGGTVSVLKRNAREISRRAGRDIEIFAAADKELEIDHTSNSFNTANYYESTRRIVQ